MKIIVNFTVILSLITMFSCSEPTRTISTKDTTQMVSFPDGSTAFLNKHSSITYTESFKDRGVRQEGEVFYAVEKGDVPFIVITATGEVRVLGTAFSVKSNKDGMEVEVEVEKGTVEFRVKKMIIKIKKGQKAVFKDVDYSLKLSKADFKHKRWGRTLKRDFKI